MRKPSARIFNGASALLILAALVVALAACGASAPPTEPDTEPAAAQYTPVASQTSDNAGGEAGYGSFQASVAAAPPPDGTDPQDANFSAEQVVAAFEETLIGIYEDVLPSVVYILARGQNTLGELPDGIYESPWGQGSGFVWDEEGHIVTNNHVVEGADEVLVFFADSTQAKGTVVGGDPYSDLAVVKLEEGAWTAHPVELGDSREVRVGQLAVAIGAPFGQEFTMTTGIVSAVGRLISNQSRFSTPEVIQTDAPINPGNSGGPLLDRQGRVIGINTQIISRTGSYSGVGMAVPVNIAARVVPPLIADGEFNYSWLGVQVRPVDAVYAEILDLPSDTRGAMIVSVSDNGPADKAGLRGSDSIRTVDGLDYKAGGDVIIAVGDTPIGNVKELLAHLTYYTSPGDEVTFEVLRDGQREEVEVTLEQRPQPDAE